MATLNDAIANMIDMAFREYLRINVHTTGGTVTNAQFIIMLDGSPSDDDMLAVASYVSKRIGRLSVTAVEYPDLHAKAFVIPIR